MKTITIQVPDWVENITPLEIGGGRVGLQIDFKGGRSLAVSQSSFKRPDYSLVAALWDDAASSWPIQINRIEFSPQSRTPMGQHELWDGYADWIKQYPAKNAA